MQAAIFAQTLMKTAMEIQATISVLLVPIQIAMTELNLLIQVWKKNVVTGSMTIVMERMRGVLQLPALSRESHASVAVIVVPEVVVKESRPTVFAGNKTNKFRTLDRVLRRKRQFSRPQMPLWVLFSTNLCYYDSSPPQIKIFL